MRHLDEESYAALLASPSRVDAALRAHLFTDCARCAEFLAARTTADALDGRVDAALLRKVPASPVPFEQRPRRLRAALGRARGVLAACAGLLLALGIGWGLGSRSGRRSFEEGIKGETTPALATSFVVVSPGGQVSRGQAGATYPRGAALSVRVELGADALVSIVRRGGDGAEVLLRNAPYGRGVHDLAQGGTPLGIPLQGLCGLQRVTVAASARPLSEAQVQQAAAGEPVEGALMSAFDVVAGPCLP